MNTDVVYSLAVPDGSLQSEQPQSAELSSRHCNSCRESLPQMSKAGVARHPEERLRAAVQYSHNSLLAAHQ